jgi:hypothetical protein
MSFRALSWAADQDCKSALQKLVLIMLANYSDDNESCFPSYKHLAKVCLCNERTIMRVIKSLQSAGLVRVESRFISGKQTSNRFILQTGTGVTNDTPQNEIRGDTGDRVGVTQTTPNTVRFIPNKKTNKKTYCSDFDEWWSIYPRRDGSKATAFDKWKKATQADVSIGDLLARTKVFAHNMRGKDLQYIAHAATWLYQKRWETIQHTTTKPKTKNSLAG